MINAKKLKPKKKTLVVILDTGVDADHEDLKGLKFHYVSDLYEVVAIAITKQKVKNAKKL